MSTLRKKYPYAPGRDSAQYAWSDALSIVIILGFTVIAGYMAVAHGLCCADDASFASVAKNLADGLGYTMTVNYDNAAFAAQTFAPRLGLGPLPIFIVAVAIHFFGSPEWLPSICTVVLNALYLCLIALALRSICGKRAPLTLALFLLVSIFININNAEFWYTMFGEVPAILATLGAYLWWCRPDRTRKHAIVAGMLAAAGFLTKELNSIYLLPLFVAAAFDLRRLPDHVLAAAVAAAMPVAIFELYRLISLGSVHDYVTNWHDHVTFISDQGQGVSVHGLALIRDRANTFRQGFDVTLWFALGSLVLSLLLLRKQKIAWLIASATVIHLLYWIFKSNGWTRYAYEALVMLGMLIAIAATISANRTGRWAIALCALAIILRAGPGIGFQARMLQPNAHAVWLAPTQDADVATLDYLEREANGQRIYTQWWAQIVNLEYLSKAHGLFEHWYFAPAPGSPFLMVTNDRLIYKGDPHFFEFMKRCGDPVFEAPPYHVYRCR